MLIPSASSPHRHARVSSPSSPSSRLSPFLKLGSISSSLPVRLSIPRRCSRAVLCCSTKSRGMAEVLKDSEPAAATSVHNSLSRSFLDVRTEEDLLFGIKKEAEAGRLPSNVARGMEELYRNYRNAVTSLEFISLFLDTGMRSISFLLEIGHDVNRDRESKTPQSLKEQGRKNSRCGLATRYDGGQGRKTAGVGWRPSTTVDGGRKANDGGRRRDTTADEGSYSLGWVHAVTDNVEERTSEWVTQVFESGIPNANEIVLSNMTVVLDRVFKDVEDPFVFSPYHRAIREPFDYYMFVKRYIRPLIDFRSSYVGNISVFREMEEKLQQGHNIVLISNHQSEADPAVIELLLEARHPHIAENMTFVAGDRVITDPLCKPFSMGRNLLCVYSKKHMNDDPELAEMKIKANTRSLKEMALLLRGGSQMIWIAPSGGRDRPDPITKEWYPDDKSYVSSILIKEFQAPFDAASVDNMRRLTEHAGVPGHIYPLAILCYDIMPPPPQVEKEIGESRVISFHGTGVSVAPAISFHEIDAACGDPEESKMAYTRALFDSVVEQYNVLNCAIHGKKGLEASVPTVSLSQPWN
ncbi:hypothetical protein RHSIM_Rhsim11G0021900 [Rhododendron simsii]|uniref:glycerol-3-phosphate 1-O-acyltransferase n=1 Tax=Rhododendron simsii TaxID=118357 RepID=A0A834L9V6_RHOSS|nr:hypothetical protein RHSIM_Rhsim11G0021900 [Rhododendron simsii]